MTRKIICSACTTEMHSKMGLPSNVDLHISEDNPTEFTEFHYGKSIRKVECDDCSKTIFEKDGCTTLSIYTKDSRNFWRNWHQVYIT